MTEEPLTIPFTRDMAQSLLEYFDRFENNGVVEIYQNNQGLWFWNEGQPLFLGLGRREKGARLNAEPNDRQRRH